MQIAFGIALGVSTVETLLICGVAYIVVTSESDFWKEHKKQTTERLKAWRVTWKNGEDHPTQG